MDGYRMMIASGACEFWKGLPGLRNKYFTLYGDNNMGAGFYTWTSAAALHNYMKTDLWGSMSNMPHL
jgi:hypothetical protein